MIEREGVTLAAGVPTLWFAVLQALENNPGRWKITRPLRIVSGGSAVPESLFRGLDRFGIRVRQIWGMTETAPMAKHGHDQVHAGWTVRKTEIYKIRAKQGMPAPFVEMRVMCAEGEAPWDDADIRRTRSARAVGGGELSRRAGNQRPVDEGRLVSNRATWPRSMPRATSRIVDRSKDLIKSGGEWISSVDLETALMNHPAVSEAAVIGVPHPKWQERPLAVIVAKKGVEVRAEELRSYLSARFAKWQLPDAFVFRTEIPRTSVGKFLKTKLREEYANWKWK